MRSIVKHSYVRGPQAKAVARAHTRYIQYREGPELEANKDGARKFFDLRQDDIMGVSVRKEITAQSDRTSLVHKFILSPGSNDIDLRQYTRELMAQISREKGLELNWKAVEHRNTQHHHVHVVVLGLDKQGRLVRFNRDDYMNLRAHGDRILERELGLERYAQEDDVRKLLAHSDYNRARGDDLYESLMRELLTGNKDEEKRKEEEEIRRKRLEDEFQEKYERDPERQQRRPMGRQQRIYEQQGRLLEWHERYEMHRARKRLTDEEPATTEREEQINEELAWLDALSERHSVPREVRALLRQDDLREQLPQLTTEIIEQQPPGEAQSTSPQRLLSERTTQDRDDDEDERMSQHDSR